MSGAGPKEPPSERHVKRSKTSLNDVSPKNSKSSCKDGLSIGGQNVESLLARGRNKMAAVKQIALNHQLDILVLGETWLPLSWTPAELEEMLLLQIPGRGRYRSIRSDKVHHENDTSQGRRGGGLLVYIDEKVKFTVTSFWECSENNTQFIELSITEPVNFDLIAIYSPPTDPARECTVSFLNTLFDRNRISVTKLMFVGDLNIDPNRETDQKFVNKFKQNNPQCRCLIDEPTHIVEPRESCVDHIGTDIPEEHIIEARVIPTYGCFSAHELVFCKIDKIMNGVDRETETKSCCQLKLPETEPLFELLPDIIRESDKCALTLFDKSAKVTTEIMSEDEIVKTAEFKRKIGKQRKSVRCTLAIILDSVQSVTPSLESLSYKVGGHDCFLLKFRSENWSSIENNFLRNHYVCVDNDCYKMFETQLSCKQHARAEHPFFKKKCRAEKCPHYFYAADLAQKHEFAKHHVCEWCDEVFDYVDEFKRHQKNEHAKCPFESCKKKFCRDKKSRNLHITENHRNQTN